MTGMEPIEPVLESPLAVPLLKQKSVACDLFTEMSSAKTAMEGMLLSNLERDGKSLLLISLYTWQSIIFVRVFILGGD